MTGPDRAATGPATPDEATLRDRIRELEAARSSMPPHAAQGLREELDERIVGLRRQLARRSGG